MQDKALNVQQPAPSAVGARDETIKLLDQRIAWFEANMEIGPSMDSMSGDDEWRFSK